MTYYGSARPGIGFKVRQQNALAGKHSFFHRCGRCDNPILKDEGVTHLACLTQIGEAEKPVKPAIEPHVDN